MKIMILGAAGYLGNKIAGYLSEKGHSVVRCIRESDLNEKPVYEYVDTDISALNSYMQENKVDWIINCVALYERGNIGCEDIFEANYAFGLRVLLSAQKNGVRKFLTIDTSLPKDLNFYSMFKKQLAEFGQAICRKTDMHFVNIMLEMFYGEDEPENRFLVSCCKKMLLNEKLALTEGTQKRDIVYIQDVCGAIETIINAEKNGYVEVPIGSGEAPAVREIVEYMHNYLNSSSELCFGEIPSRNNEPDCVADLTVLNEIGYQIKYSWQKGLEHFCDEIKKRV